MPCGHFLGSIAFFADHLVHGRWHCGTCGITKAYCRLSQRELLNKSLHAFWPQVATQKYLCGRNQAPVICSKGTERVTTTDNTAGGSQLGQVLQKFANSEVILLEGKGTCPSGRWPSEFVMENDGVDQWDGLPGRMFAIKLP